MHGSGRIEGVMTVRASSGYGIVQRAIDEERCVVLDGGVATELPHRHGQDEERLWGIEALASSPAAVLGVHRRYVAAGVGVLTTNTWGLPTALAGDGQISDDLHRPVHWMEVARRGVRVARQAIAEGGREGECAVAFALNGDLDGPDGPENVSLLRRALAEDLPDLFVVETLSVVRPSLFAVVEAMLEASVPVWLSFRRCRHGLCGVYGQHWGGPEGDAFGRAARRFEDMGAGGAAGELHPARPRRRHGRLPARLHRPAARRLPQPRVLHERRLAVRERDRGRRLRRDGAAVARRGRPDHRRLLRHAPRAHRGCRRRPQRHPPGAGAPRRAFADRRGGARHRPRRAPGQTAAGGRCTRCRSRGSPSIRASRRRSPAPICCGATCSRRARAPTSAAWTSAAGRACTRRSSRSTARCTCTRWTSTSAPWRTRSTTRSATGSPSA